MQLNLHFYSKILLKKGDILNNIGRLDDDDQKIIDDKIDQICESLKKKHHKKAEKILVEFSNTPNHFVREYLGKNLVFCEHQKELKKIAETMLKHKIYGIRATALFYLVELNKNKPENIFEIIKKVFDKVPWESEIIINEMWRRFPQIAKEKMLLWAESEHENMRALSFHGMENIATEDTDFVMKFITKVIDDESVAVQKKISHILTQVLRANPIVVFPYIYEWLEDADDQRIKTIWVAMKKLANIVAQRKERGQEVELVMLTEQTIKDWKNDDNKKVSNSSLAALRY